MKELILCAFKNLKKQSDLSVGSSSIYILAFTPEEHSWQEESFYMVAE